MRVDLNLTDLGHDHACELLQCVCEGMVLANMIEIHADHEAFPCCIKCGELRLIKGGNPLELQGARTIIKRGGGNALSLACFQAAARRIEKDPHARVFIEHVERNGEVVVGAYKPLVQLEDDSFEDPEHEAVRAGGCGCSGEDEDHVPQGEGEARNALWAHIPPVGPAAPVVFKQKRGFG